MRELIEKLEQLKEEISKEEVIIQYVKEKKKIFSNNEIVSKIEQYKTYPSEKLKKEIENSPSFLAYKKKELDVNIFIFGINQKFKELNHKVDCRKE